MPRFDSASGVSLALRWLRLHLSGSGAARRPAPHNADDRREDEMSRIRNFIERTRPWAVKNSKIAWVVTYSVACVVLFIIFVVSFRNFLGLDVLDYTGAIGIAAILGLVGVIGVSVALMGAIFYSSRSGIDDEVRDARDISRDSK